MVSHVMISSNDSRLIDRNVHNRLIDIDISNQLIFDSVYTFVKKLPYSMDPKNAEYIPADLYNHFPISGNVLKRSLSDMENVSLFLELQTWGDTRRTSYVVQLCYIFQQMLKYNLDLRDIIGENTFEIWGVIPEYQKMINDILKTFPMYYDKIQKSLDEHMRNEYLEQVYEEIKKAFNRFSPKSDLEMFYYFNNVEYKLISLNEYNSQCLISENSKILSLVKKKEIVKKNN